MSDDYGLTVGRQDDIGLRSRREADMAGGISERRHLRAASQLVIDLSLHLGVEEVDEIKDVVMSQQRKDIIGHGAQESTHVGR